jgi:hypothetical protein
MPARGHKFTAVATALIVLVAHVLCVCRSVSATPAAAAEAAAHTCCKQDPPPAPQHPAHDPDRHCSHCDGIATPALTPNDGGAAHHLPAFHLAPLGTNTAAAAALASLEPSRVAAHARGLPVVSPPTLLRLHCALNL